MPRRARLVIPGHPLHIAHRGVNRGACFANDTDRRFYLGLLQELLPDSGCALHAYVLMTNHVHLLLTPDDEGGPSSLMKAVAQRHAQRCNKQWRRTGPLWEGRFKSSVVDSAEYALRCYRYIEENPLRAGMVRHPAEYAWSSFRANALGFPCAFLSEHEAWLALGGDSVDRRIAYRAMFDDPQPERELEVFRDALKTGLAAGSAEFIEQVAAATGRRAARRNRIARLPKNSAKAGLSPV